MDLDLLLLSIWFNCFFTPFFTKLPSNVCHFFHLRHSLEEDVRISWVLRVIAEPEDMGDETSHSENAPTRLVIYFVRRLGEPDFQFCVDNVTLHGPASLCEEWVIALTDHLHKTGKLFLFDFIIFFFFLGFLVILLLSLSPS